MADLRITPGTVPTVARPQSGARAEAARAAQAAFFQAALNGTQSAPAAGPATAPTAVAATAATTRAADPASPPQRLLRPGSLLDIKV